MDSASLLRSAITALAQNCDHVSSTDGVGFNRFDTEFGHHLAQLDIWTPRQAEAAYKMVAKYAKQLERFGIKYSDISPPPPIPVKSNNGNNFNKPVSGLSYIQGLNLIIDCDYNKDMIDDLRSIPGRIWDKQLRLNRINLTPISSQISISVIDKWKLKYQNNTREILVKIAESSKVTKSLSHAENSELSINGLGGELYPFQRAAVEYVLRSNSRAIISDEPGIGKTVSALALLHVLGAFPAIVACPANVKLVWRNHIEGPAPGTSNGWLPERSAVVLSGRKSKLSVVKNADIIIINWDILSYWSDTLIELNPKAFVLDESHNIKNNKSLRCKAAKKISKSMSNGSLICELSGTPIMNNAQELITQLDVIKRLKDIGGYPRFMNRYVYENRTDELYDWLRSTCMIRRLKKQVLPELPLKTISHIPVEINNRKEYDKEIRTTRDFLNQFGINGPLERAKTIVLINNLRQIIALGKLPSAISWLSNFLESDRKIVVFAYHVAIQNKLKESFSNCAQIFGVDDMNTRQNNIDRFQNDDDCNIIICSLKAAREGITLTAASDVFFLELDWTPASLDQAQDRVHRIGQTYPVTCHYMLGENTIDIDMLNLLDKKRRISDSIMDGKDIKQASIFSDLIKRITSS